MKTDLPSQERIDVLCRIRSRQLRAWKKYSIDREVSRQGCIRPEAYSSCSPSFRGFLQWWYEKNVGDTPSEAVLWIMESPSNPRAPHRSLVAKIVVRHFYIGGCQVPATLKDYVRSWTGNKRFQEKDSTVAEADPAESRFYPANNLGRLASQLRYVNQDGSRNRNVGGMMLRIHPEDVATLSKAAEVIANRTVFVSYKHDDFKKGHIGCRPPWEPEDLAKVLIHRGLGVWLDSLCAPRRRRAAGKTGGKSDWTEDEVRRLLAEGYAQSQVVLAIDTPNYGTPGVNRTKWTLLEYQGKAGLRPRASRIRRFVLHPSCSFGLKHVRKLKPDPDDAIPWPNKLGDQLVDRLKPLFDPASRRCLEPPLSLFCGSGKAKLGRMFKHRLLR